MFLLVPAYPGNPGPKAVKRLCVCVCVCYTKVNVRTGLVAQAVPVVFACRLFVMH